LAALTSAWRELFDLIRPELVVFDHSPTALLAARGLPLRRVVIGTGFSCPPDVEPLPRLQPGDEDAIRRNTSGVLASMNYCLACWNQPPMDRVLQFYGDVEDTILATFPKLDHYGRRIDANYWGAWTQIGGHVTEWPLTEGPRVFGYLKWFKALPNLLEELSRRNISSLLFIDGLTNEFRRKYASTTLRLENQPLDMRQVAQQCDVALLNGTHGSAVAMLLAGKPALHIPLFLEQSILARSVVRISEGLSASPEDPQMVQRQFNRLLASDDYREGASLFTAKYADFDPILQLQKLVDRVESLAAN